MLSIGGSALMPADSMLSALTQLVPVIQERAVDLDVNEAFPDLDFAALRELGALNAALPVRLGGYGAGTEPGGVDLLLDVLRTLGQGNLAVGRLFEAHVNAVQLITAYGTPSQIERAAADTKKGHLFGLWVTDPAAHPLLINAGALHGRKGPCSGAGFVTRALVTVRMEDGARLAFIELDDTTTIEPMRGVLQGMRASTNAVVHFNGTAAPETTFIGQPGDYLREPHLSCGAWRTTAVTLGGLDCLVAATKRQLVQKAHQDAPLQQERFGRMLIAQETARLWTVAAARRTELAEGAVPDRVAYVNLARIAVEAACLDAMQLAQRTLGLSAFVCPNPVERLLRDLAVYLRQPAPDAVLTEAAHHALIG